MMNRPRYVADWHPRHGWRVLDRRDGSTVDHFPNAALANDHAERLNARERR